MPSFDYTKRERVVLGVLLGIGCVFAIHNACVVRNTPINPPSEFRITQTLATLIEANKGATQFAILLNRQGILSTDLTAAILDYNEAVARASKQSLEIASSPEMGIQDRVKAIRSILGVVAPQESVSKWLGENASDAQIAALIGSITAVRNLINLLIADANAIAGPKAEEFGEGTIG